MNCRTCNQLSDQMIDQHIKQADGQVVKTATCKSCYDTEWSNQMALMDTKVRYICQGKHTGKRVYLCRKDMVSCTVSFTEGGKEYKFDSSYIRMPKIEEL